MKKLFVLVCLAALLVASDALWAGGVDNLTEQTVTYARRAAMYASVDENAPVYNPAGVMFMPNGLFIFVSNLTALDTTTQKPGNITPLAPGTSYDDEYKAETNAWVVPALTLTYKQEEWAAFFAFDVLSGGGAANFKDGSISSTFLTTSLAAALLVAPIGLPLAGGFSAIDSDVTGSSFYFGFTLGGAYKVMDGVSVAAGGRFVKAMGSTEINGTFTHNLGGPLGTYDIEYKSEESAEGWGGVFGLNMEPAKGFLIAITYATEVALEKEIDKVDSKVDMRGAAYIGAIGGAAVEAGIEAGLKDGIDSSLGKEGDKSRRNLPAALSVGIAYNILESLKIMADFGYYFQKDAAWDGAQKEYGNAWDTALGLELAVMPSLKVSTGVAYTNKGTDSKDFSSLESPSYDTIGVGLGFEFEILTDLRFEAAYAKEFYKDIKQEGTGTKLDNTRNAFGFGLKYKFM